MSFSNSSPILNKTTGVPLTQWELKTFNAQRDLIIKKVVIALIALLNFVALGTVLYFIISYCPVPTQAILVSPFIVGVLAALAYLKFPTFGVSSVNYSNYLNPTSLIGRGLAYLFFGPLMYAISKLDWTPYHDPIRANKISKNLEELPFYKLAEEYGLHFDNLIKYGFIPEKNEEELIALYEEYLPIKKEIDFWKEEGLEECAESKEAQEKKERLEEKWLDLKNKFDFSFPHPPKPILDFSKRTTDIKLKARAACCFGPPIDILHFNF